MDLPRKKGRKCFIFNHQYGSICYNNNIFYSNIAMTKRAFNLKKTMTAVLLASMQLFAYAQESEKNGPPPTDLDLIDETEQPAITIRRPGDRATITERRDNGVVREIRVQTGRSTYYLFPNEPAGSAMRGDTESIPVRPALWRVHEFDIGESKQEEKQEKSEQQPSAPVPPPPAIKE